MKYFLRIVIIINIFVLGATLHAHNIMNGDEIFFSEIYETPSIDGIDISSLSEDSGKERLISSFFSKKSKYFRKQDYSSIRIILNSLTEDQILYLTNLKYVNPTTNLLWSIFFGYVGIDRFMIEQYGLGIAKWLTLGGFGFWWIADWFQIRKLTKKYNYINFYYTAQRIKQSPRTTPTIQTNPSYPAVANTGLSEQDIKIYADKNNDGIVGIYEDGAGYCIGVIKENNQYKVIYIRGNQSQYRWRMGDLQGTLRESATTGLFMTDWYMHDKNVTQGTVIFDGYTMKLYIQNGNVLFIKMYPKSDSKTSRSGTATGTGYAITNDGYLVTNHHVIDGAKSIHVRGVKEDISKKYKARIVAQDANNDLAILKIDDNGFNGFGANIPYRLSTKKVQVGEDIFVLGYPMSSVMGNEIKFTKGVINSLSGFKGDITLYQIDAPIQHGNSGSPLFDKDGDVIATINSGITSAENVGYAIKMNYLNNLIENKNLNIKLPTNNNISRLSREDKIKTLRKFVFLIEVEL